MRRFAHRFGMALLCCVLITGAARPDMARAQAQSDVPDVQRFDNGMKEFRQRLGDVNEKIRRTIDAIRQNNDRKRVMDEVGQLRGVVSELLGQAADNGTVAEIGHLALDNARRKLAEVQQDTHFSQEQRSRLIGQWRNIVADTERGVQGLHGSRKQLEEVLRALQTNEDFLIAQAEIERARNNIDLINDLTDELRRLSEEIKRTLAQTTTPSS